MLRSIKYGLYGAVLAGLIATTIAWVSVDKSVHLVVDGHPSTVTTTASDVSEVLQAHGYRVDRHDLLAPSASTGLHDGMRVVLRHGRLLHLNVDGQPKAVWTTATTVQMALTQLGYSSADFVSVSRSRRVPLTGSAFAIRTPRSVTVLHDGRTEHVTTTDATVGQLLKDMSITVGPRDRLSALQSSALRPGETVRLQRVGERTVVKTVAVAYPVTRRQDTTLAAGKTSVLTKGKKGTRAVSYSVLFVDGKAVHSTRLGSRMVHQPRAKVVQIGTKTPKHGDTQNTPSIKVANNPDPGSAKGIAQALLAKRGWSDQYSCLVQMWDRESGWRTDAANPSGAYGIPQALPGSKMSSAGSELADQRHHPDHVGAVLHRRALQHPLRRLVLLAGARLLLIDRP